MKNKNQKRIRNRAWTWIVTAGLTIGSLTGCGSQTVEQTAQGEKTDGEVTITIWHDKEDAVTQVLEEGICPIRAADPRSTGEKE